jgi:hypothetical protein
MDSEMSVYASVEPLNTFRRQVYWRQVTTMALTGA